MNFLARRCTRAKIALGAYANTAGEGVLPLHHTRRLRRPAVLPRLNLEFSFAGVNDPGEKTEDSRLQEGRLQIYRENTCRLGLRHLTSHEVLVVICAPAGMQFDYFPSSRCPVAVMLAAGRRRLWLFLKSHVP
jgi:hypothetical protein